MIFLRSDLPVAHDASARLLPWLVAMMMFLATLALAGALSLDGMVGRWTVGLSGTLTVQIPPADSPDETAARVERAVRVLRSLDGVETAEAVPDATIEALLQPWLASPDLIDSLPVPRLVDVELTAGATPDLVAMAGRVADVAPGAEIDDHRVWLSRLISLAEGLRLLAWAVVGLVMLTVAATVTHGVRTALDVHRPHIEVLHLIGATDAYIARQFARRALWQGLIGGIGGLVLAGPALWVIGRLAARLEGGLIPAVTLEHWQFALLSLTPVVSAAISMIVARLTVRRRLARML